jgi:hypothetical protein
MHPSGAKLRYRVSPALFASLTSRESASLASRLTLTSGVLSSILVDLSAYLILNSLRPPKLRGRIEGV